MSLYFNERTDEEQKNKEDPSKDLITFTYPWIIDILPPNNNEEDEEEIDFDEIFRTNYKFHFATWYINLIREHISIRTSFHVNENHEQIRVWNGTCFISYDLYSDNDMKALLYSSPRIQMIKPAQNRDLFETPDLFMTKFVEVFDEKKLSKIVIYVELQLPVKYFGRPFDMPSCALNRNLCDKYPKNIQSNFRFEFLRESDFTIKCSDGSMPALQMALNVSSKFMKKCFAASNDNELFLSVGKMDVVKPIVIFLHSRCFEMPTTYDLNYVERLLDVIEYFEPQQERILLNSIHLSLCQKFVQEHLDFDSILQWTSLAFHHSFHHLERMISNVIANKFYYQWNQTFPVNTRNNEHQMFYDVFGNKRLGEALYMFYEIENIMANSFLTNTIL